ncbi:MAG: MotA/TolQ/ExbB proton channel family protein [Myxococcota bacterium]
MIEAVRSVVDTLVAGGVVMIPIGICSVVATAALLERLWALQRSRIVPRGLVIEVIELIKQERFEDAVTLCRKEPSPISRVLEVALLARHLPRAEIKERVEEIGRREAAELERFVPILGTVASISPLLGLLGTVGGMIQTFQVIQTDGAGNVGNLAGGISEALITTFAGLLVGIPSLVANRFVLARVDALIIDLEEVALGVVNQLTEQPAEPES